MIYHVKVRKVGEKRFYFLAPAGAMTRLRIHASQFTGKSHAEEMAATLAKDNPTYEFKVVPA